MSTKKILTAALTGAIHIPSMSEYLPITPKQIIEQGIEAAEAGAAALHIHARIPESGQPTNDVALLKEIASGIKAKSNVIIGITTGGKLGSTVEERLAAIPAIKPELASCNAGSMNFFIARIADKIKDPKYDWELPYVKGTEDLIFPNTFKGMQTYITTMLANNTRPEFEVYDVNMLNSIDYFVKNGTLTGKIYIQFVLGIMGGMPANVDNLLFLINTAKKYWGDDFVWSCAAAGKTQFEMVTVAMIMGGNARVGLEDNLYLSKGRLAKSSAEQIVKIRHIAEELGYEAATPDEARVMLGIKK